MFENELVDMCCEDCKYFDEYNGYCILEEEYVSAFTLACEKFEEIECETNE